MLHDTVAVRRIKEGVDYMYNLEFDKAEKIFSAVEKLYPGHPVYYLLKGIYSYWEKYPMLPTSEARESFENDLRKCIELCSDESYSEKYEAESLLTNVCARGLLLLFYNDNDLIIKVIPLATGTYKYIRRSFDFVSSFADFYYMTGIYNYYREAYPRMNPIYKPIASLFPPGDIVRGLSELGKAAELSIFLKAESYALLSYIYTGFENDFIKAMLYSRILVDKYPANPYFKALHIKNLMIIKEYGQAENLIKSYRYKSGNKFLDAQILIFNGILQEKKYSNYSLAEKYYEDGINAITFAGDFGDEFTGYAYLGLSRICDIKGDKTGKKAYRKKGIDLLDFKKITFD
ncbi:MAG TPA: hypothetical protein DDW27_10725 [Bacteroidales bacterium]|nr:hypothetical protein [Bacteroidales bacterium]